MSLDELKFSRTNVPVRGGGQALASCQLAKELEDSGRYDEAVAALGEVWPGVGEQPAVEVLGERSAAEVFLRAGTLTGWLGSSRQLNEAQESAKDLLSEAHARFESLGDKRKAAESLVELAFCYWRQGAMEEARATLDEARARLAPEDYELRALAALRGALIEVSATRYNEALRVLTESAPLFEASGSDALKGKYHNQLAAILWFLSRAERREDYTDRALIEYAAASFHFERAGHAAYRAAVENNLGYLFLTAARLREAHEHLDCARRLFARLKDGVHTAQVDETRARVLLAEGRLAEAEALAGAAALVLARGGEQALLAEALTTRGVALARLGRHTEARESFARASEVAERAGNVEGAGLAELALLEELCERLTPREVREAYAAADRLLARTQCQQTLARLRASAHRLITAEADARAEGARPGGAANSAEHIIRRACEAHGKRVSFEPAAVNALSALLLRRGADELRSLVERTVERAAEGATISAAAVETLALRHDADGADFTDPWAGFSFKDEVRSFEESLIERALQDASGRVSHAARLLGFRHHESLNWRLKNRNKTLLPARTPARRRRRSVITKHD